MTPPRRLQIATIGDPILRAPTARVEPEDLASPEIQALIDDMIATVRHVHGAGLAANQVFRSLAICVIEVRDNPRYPYKPRWPLTILVNPVVTPIGSETFSNFEGCLSVPDLRGRVRRACHVEVAALDRGGRPLRFEVKGLTAGTFQHELDHLEGRLFVDRVDDPNTLCTWANFQRYHEAGFRDEVAAIVARWGS